MKYTADQLVALVEEARGYVHDAAMGAIWTKDRHAKLANFMERTDVVEYNADGGYVMEKSLEPFKRNKIKVNNKTGEVTIVPGSKARMIAVDCKMVKDINKHNAAVSKSKTALEKVDTKAVLKYADKVARDILSVQPINKDVFKKTPQEQAQDLVSMGYHGGDGPIDDVVRNLKDHGVEGSRDFLREVVKLIREHKENRS